jgi:uncharacterized protein (DUF924 family)
MPVWFQGADKDFDLVQHENVELICDIGGRISNNTLEGDWLSNSGILASILLLDQFPRVVFRGTASAFQYDALTASLVRKIVDTDDFLSTQFCAIQRFFMCVALQHSEMLSDQALGVELASKITHDSSVEVQEYFRSLPGYPLEHHDVIARFGRFPSRNLALGRESTVEELEWMASPECPGWARSQMPQTQPGRKKDDV